VSLQRHRITEDFGALDNDPYDHYIGTTDTRTGLRFRIVNDKELDELMESCIPDNPYDYESIDVLHEFYYEHEVKRFIECMVKRNGN